MRYWVIFVVIVLAFLLVSCGTQGESEVDTTQDIEAETPQEAVDLAIQVAAEECETLPGDTCQEFKLACSEKIALSEADTSKDIEEKWCLAIGYQKRSPTLSPDWKDEEGNYSIEKVGGQWQEKGFCICRLGKGEDESEN